MSGEQTWGSPVSGRKIDAAENGWNWVVEKWECWRDGS